MKNLLNGKGVEKVRGLFNDEGGKKMKGLLNNKGIATIAVILIIAGSVVAVLGTAGAYVGYNAYQEKKHEEEAAAFFEEVSKAQTQAVNGYNDRVEQVMSELSFTDENGQVVLLENCRNIDDMNRAIGLMNTILEDVNKDELLSQEQKDALAAAFNEKINSINARISVVTEENRIAEEEARKEAEAEKAREQKRTSQSSYNQSSQDGSSEDAGSSEEASNNGRPRWIDLGDGFGKYENEGGEWVEARPEYGFDRRFYDRTGIFAAGIRFKDEHPDAVVHFSGMGIDKTI